MELKDEFKAVIEKHKEKLSSWSLIDGFGHKPNEVYYSPFPNAAFETDMVEAFRQTLPAPFFANKDWIFLDYDKYSQRRTSI